MSKKVIRSIISILVILPIFYMIIWAFIESWPFESILPKDISFRAWKSLFGNFLNVKVIFSSIFMSLLVAFLSLVLTYPASKALALFEIRFKNIIRLLLFFPIILPITSVGLGLHLSFLKMGLSNTFLGVVIVHIFPCIPYCIMILEPVFASVGDKYEKQAMLLGANSLQRFLYVNFPLVLPAIRSAFFISFIVSFSQYFLTFLIGGGLVRTYASIMFPILNNKDRHEMAVFSIVFLFICLFVASVSFLSFRKRERK